MKKFLLLAFLSVSGLSCLFAQEPSEPLDPQKDKIVSEGYLIKLIPADAGGYGYDIFKQNMLVVHQSLNPFTMTPRGLETKEDAYKTAKWQVMQLKKENSDLLPRTSPVGTIPERKGTQSNQRISKQVAQQLNIRLQSNF